VRQFARALTDEFFEQHTVKSLYIELVNSTPRLYTTKVKVPAADNG